jgi:general stress protein 26
VWVPKLATMNKHRSIRITPLTYGVDNHDIIFSTWQNSATVRNVRRSAGASVLIDKPDQPYAGVHYTGQAEVLGDDITLSSTASCSSDTSVTISRRWSRTSSLSGSVSASERSSASRPRRR